MNSLYTSLNFGLGEEVDMLRDAVQDFVFRDRKSVV